MFCRCGKTVNERQEEVNLNLGTFYQTCSYICMVLIAVNLAFAFVVGLGVFGDNFAGGIQTTDDTGGMVDEFTNVSASTDTASYTGMDALWIIIGGSVIGTAGGLFLGYITHSSVFVGIGLFSGVFWSSYLNSLGILYIGGFIQPLADVGFILIGSVLMIFMFAGAIIGMLSGSG